MIFSTTIFLFVFLPLFLTGYYLLPFRFRSAWIVLGSWVFYGWWRIDFLGLMVLVTLWTYLIGRWIESMRANEDPGPRTSAGGEVGRPAKTPVAVGVVLNIGVLAYFKYFNFGADTVNFFLESVGAAPFAVWQVILPIGISFYLFQATSYLVDVYRGDVPAAKRYVDLAAYISLFPQLIAGPIIRYKDIGRQIASRDHTWEKFSKGAFRFMIGFCKKVLVADTVATLTDAVFALPAPSLADSWLGALAYTVQLYYDFSGYSDMAIGLGLMMGFRLMENFNFPYISSSITEFWRRWHISLSSWLKDYLYIPLGGNRKGVRRTYVNLIIVMMLGGLWHGAAWTFVAWGTFHGILLAVERARESRKFWDRIPKPLSVARTMFFVVIGWVMFRAGSFTSALDMYAGMIGLNGTSLSGRVSWRLNGFALSVLAFALVIVFAMPWLRARFDRVPEAAKVRIVRAQYVMIPVFLFSILKVIADSYSPFLYFQF
jgi:alginate O-acetyltransferase complex protein AlgI